MSEKLGSEGLRHEIDVKSFTADVNRTARREYPAVAKLTGMRNRFMPTRLALREETPYPYNFIEATDLILPNPQESFGRIVRKSRDSGIEEIHRTIGDATEEHSWLFVPEQSLWIDDTIAAEGHTVIGDPYLVTFLSHLYPTIEMVHTHPDKVIEQVRKDMAMNDPHTSEPYLYAAAMPSSNDFQRHMQLYARSNKATRFISSIVSHYGITSFELNEEGKKTQGFSISQIRDYKVNPDNDPADEIINLLSYTKNLGYDDQCEPTIPIFTNTFTSVPSHQ